MASSSRKSARFLSGIEGISDRALSRVVNALHEHPEALGASNSSSAYGRHVGSVIRTVGTVKHTIALTTGQPLLWEVLALQDLLPHLCNESPPFCQLLGQIYSEYGADWHAVLYCDGVTPGAVLAPGNSRESLMWYTTLLEFGAKLSHQELWSCIACIETAVSKLVPAQVSGLTRLLVKDMVCGDRAANVAGIVLPVGVDMRPEMVRVHYHATLADEEALSAMLGLKGASGIAPCAMRCWCVGKERQQDIDSGVRPLTARVAGLVDITCCTKADILLKGDADVWEDCDHLAAAPPNRLQDLERAVGINYHPDGISFDRALRRSFKPCTSHRYDPLHVLFSNGLLGAEIVLFLKEAKRHARVTFANFREYSELRRWMPTGRSSPSTVFSAHREKASDTYLKAGASELLAVYSLLREWALSACRDISAMRPSLKSLLILLDVVDLVVKAATTRVPADHVEDIAARLDNAAFAHLKAFADAHGRIEMMHNTP